LTAPPLNLDHVLAFTVAPDGGWLAASGRAGAGYVWDPAPVQSVRTAPPRVGDRPSRFCPDLRHRLPP
jgi:hypothetical protein